MRSSTGASWGTGRPRRFGISNQIWNRIVIAIKTNPRSNAASNGHMGKARLSVRVA
jgi:hypothetical protein